MTDWPFGDLRPLAYGAILADPPWRFALRGPKGEAKSPQAHYSCMELGDIMALPVHGLARGDCLLWMWATWPMLPHALVVMKAWGFRYVTGGAWHKKTSGGKTAFGTGYVLRSACEPFLIGKIGQPDYASRSVRNVIEAERLEHSRKPDAAHEMIEALVPGAFRLELFARRRRPGWDAWGNELCEDAA